MSSSQRVQVSQRGRAKGEKFQTAKRVEVPEGLRWQTAIGARD